MSTGVALVTGCSSGIGAASAVELAGRGWTVAATVRRSEALGPLEGVSGVSTFVLDVAQPPSIRAALEQVTDQLGEVDVLVNNAGYALLGPVEELDLDAIRRQFEVNVFGLLDLTQLVLPSMRRRRRGRVVNISSTAGFYSNPFSGAYAASKFALEAVSDALRMELAPWGVDVVIVEPGPIESNFIDRAHAESHYVDASPYAPYVERMDSEAEGFGKRLTKPAAACARVVANAAGARHPKARYRVTAPAHVLPIMQRVLPSRALDFAFKRMLGLHKAAPER
jgi:NAD(P)-dependent dehydrogenase (short-subunit alcohol dehydrogenase family)